MVAAAHVHTIKQYGPDRVAGFSPIPAMSMVSHAAGARFVSLIGGAMLSFYDWYADLPVASPQVFGDQTDVPESGDWWDASYLILWGSNVPVTRTPDAHWMTEARYRGQKVVVMSPDYSDATKFADDWLAPHPGTDAALAMAMGHVVLKEFFVDRETPRFVDYCKQYTDLPFLVTLARRGEAFVPDKFLTASDLGDSSRGRRVQDRADRRRDRRADRPERHAGRPVHRVRHGPLEPRPGQHRPAAHAAQPIRFYRRGPVRHRSRRPAALRQPRRRRRRAAPRGADPRDRRAAGHHRLRPAARPVRRRPPRATGELAHLVRRPHRARHAGLAGAVHRRPRRRGDEGRARVRGERRGVRRPLDDHHGRRDEPLVPLRHDLPGVPRAHHAHRLPGRERRRVGALRRAGEVPAGHGLVHAGVRPRLGAPAAADDPDRVLVPAHRPVALRPHHRRGACVTVGFGAVRREDGRGRGRPVGADGLDALASDVRPQPPRPRRRDRRVGAEPGRVRGGAAAVRRAAVRLRGPRRARELPAGADDLAREPARVVVEGKRVLPQAPARHRLVAAGHRGAARGPPARTWCGASRRPPGSSTCWSIWTSG